jgi:SAM-dependent methyltransferase
VPRPGLSRRALFGLGLSRLGDRVDANLPAPAGPKGPRAPDLEDLRRRWADARATGGTPLWAPVGADLRERAGPLAGAYVLVDRVSPPDGARGIGRVPPEGGVLPLGDGTFDAALSAFGPQATPDGRTALGELARVVAPGGRLAFALWAGGAVAALLREAAALDPLPPDLPGAWEWGSPARVRETLSETCDDIAVHPGELVLELEAVDALDSLAGAVPAVGAALARTGAKGRDRLEAVLAAHAEAVGDRFRIPVAYVVVVATAR